MNSLDGLKIRSEKLGMNLHCNYRMMHNSTPSVASEEFGPAFAADSLVVWS